MRQLGFWISSPRLRWLGLVVGAFCAHAFAQQQAVAADKAPSTLPSLTAIKACAILPRNSDCLDKLFRETLKTHSTREVLKLVARFEAQDLELRRDCHPVVHAIGRETFRIKGTIHDSFEVCDETCHSGCYHGSVERFLLGDRPASADTHPSLPELRLKAATACYSDTPYRLRFQCLHGLGHAVLYFTDYELSPALGICDALADDWSRNSCYGGLFMENVFNATNERKNFRATDYHFPCNQLADKYRGECYMMQTTRMKEMGLATEGLLRECAKAGSYSRQCTQSIGRDLSNTARFGEPRAAAAACELAQGEGRLACMRGVVFALNDNTWDGRYAFPFCDTFKSGEDRETCLKESISYMKSLFEKTADDIKRDCTAYAPGSTRCVELAVKR